MKRKTPALVTFMIALPLVCLLSLTIGSAKLPLPDLLSGLFCRVGYETEATILYAIRIPRLLAALLAGVGLSLSGVLLQAVMANPLASPNTVGVNAGAGLFAVLSLSLLPGIIPFLSVAAFVGAFLTTLILLLVAKVIGHSASHTVILAGIACTSLFQAVISFCNILDADVLVAYNAFAVGSLEGVKAQSLWLPAFLIAASLAVALSLSWRIEALTLGDAVAASLGIRASRLRTLCLILASLCAAAVVSFAGLLGFVGLVVPHMTRKLFGNGMRFQIVMAPLVGAVTLSLSDLAARTLFMPAEIPVGIVTALIGAPFFLYLLLRTRKEEPR